VVERRQSAIALLASADLLECVGPTFVMRVARIGLAVLGPLLLGATVLGFLGSWWWGLVLVEPFRPQYLGASGVLAAVAWLIRMRGWAIALTGAAVVNLAVLWPYLTGIPAVPAEGSALLDVVSFNVGISVSGRDRVMEWLAEEDPDVVLLYESSFEWEDAVRRSGLEHEMVAVVPPTRLAGITVLVRPEYQVRVLEGLPVDISLGVVLQVEVGGESVEIVGLHPPSPLSSERARIRDEILSAGGDWAADSDAPVLVIGDFNATPWSHVVKSMARVGGLTDSLKGRGLQPSWPAGWGPLMIPIDNALTSQGLVVVERRTGPPLGSDHRPLLVTVAVSPPLP
jgi:endonuclease/exonuclease/phosphatase (EEP) superfamily protein YafD